jgi:geranylgeranyl diphosphate synthase type I
LYEQELSNLHFGQGFDIWWHHGHKDPVVDEYLQMCAYKTGTLARLSAKLAALMSNATQEQIDAIGLFAEAIGVGFQIQVRS